LPDHVDLAWITSKVSDLERRVESLERQQAPDPLPGIVTAWLRGQERSFAFAAFCQELKIPNDRTIRRKVSDLLRRQGWTSYRSRGRLWFRRFR